MIWQIISGFLVFVPVIVGIVILGNKGKYKQGFSNSPFFFEKGRFIINSGIPVEYDPDTIEEVQLEYNEDFLESQSRYKMSIHVIQKGEKKGRSFVYMGGILGKKPADFQAELDKHGIAWRKISE